MGSLLLSGDHMVGVAARAFIPGIAVHEPEIEAVSADEHIPVHLQFHDWRRL